MKKSAMTILLATFFCLSFVSQKTLAKSSGHVRVMDKPDLAATNVVTTSAETIRVTVVSHNYTITSNTITVLLLAYPDKPKEIYDFVWKHEALIEQTVSPGVPTDITINLPSAKSLYDSGVKRVSAMVDSTNKVDESDESNNTVTKEVTGYSTFPNTADAKLKDVISFKTNKDVVRTGTSTAPLKIAKSTTPGCHSGKCNATLTVRVLKTPTTSSQGVDVKITNAETGGEWDGSVTFESGQTVKDVPIMVSLQDGQNKLKVKITMVVTKGGDPDESNNTLVFTIILIEG